MIMKKILLCQISNTLINPKRDTIQEQYYDKLYSGARSGYRRNEDFWEIPQWIAEVTYIIPNTSFHIIRNTQESIEFINRSDYDYICFSVLEANKKLIKQILDNTLTSCIVGGYVKFDKYWQTRCVVCRTIEEMAKHLSITYKFGKSYRHFSGVKTIPRLTLSKGCLYNCSFCNIKPHGQVIDLSIDDILNQINSLQDLTFELIYIDDKTFGQSKNIPLIPTLYYLIKTWNKAFKGFIIQTTAKDFLKLEPSYFLFIAYIEIGIESFNDDILKTYHKPHDTKLIRSAFKKAREFNVMLIPNIIVGIKEEDEKSYLNTLTFLSLQIDIISHLNLYSLSIYGDTELTLIYGINPINQNENDIQKTWIKNDDVHVKYYEKFHQFGIDLLEREV